MEKTGKYQKVRETLPRLGSRVRIPSPAPNFPYKSRTREAAAKEALLLGCCWTPPIHHRVGHYLHFLLISRNDGRCSAWRLLIASSFVASFLQSDLTHAHGRIGFGSSFRNQGALPLYSPIRHAHKVKAPTLVIAGRTDSVTPATAAQRIPNGRFELLDSNHFQPYIGDMFEKNIALQLAFLREVLPARNEGEIALSHERRNVMNQQWMIYGAYGYTGELMVREAVRRGLWPSAHSAHCPALTFETAFRVYAG
jgi:hypothetical protein